MNDKVWLLHNAEYIQSDNNYFIKVNNKLYHVNLLMFNILNDIKYNKDIKGTYKLTNTEWLTIKSKIDSFLLEVLKEKDLSTSYIKNIRSILKNKQLEQISNIFKYLFNKSFYVLFILIVALNFYIFFSKNIKLTLDFNFLINTIVIYPIFILSIFIHEIGHVSACKSFNISPKRIGIGFYFIFPVFFSDITDIWILEKNKKIIINLGGVYFQFIFNLIIFFISSFFTGIFNSILLHIFYINIISCLFCLIPFFRNDGYWIYSDYFDIKNLYEKSDIFFQKYIATRSLKNFSLPIILFSFSNWAYRLLVIFILVKILLNNLNIIVFHTNTSNQELYISILWSLVSLLGVYKSFEYIFNTLIKKQKNINSF
ncbi:hypothetical protein [Elizabethkingia meningoseptica]|uniref:hypothetical protein n=1 Tax=Elizabethkingia meningoseptica TaxID=238 RepID=UPI0038922184